MLKRPFLGLMLVCATLAQPVLSAPLFPDVKDDHWAKDAVAALAAKGLLEGYPDGTFKGDRAASRWEVAMIVARLLAKMEQAHATFATKAELEEVRKLANSLKDELDALGIRVKNLEDSTDRLDKRVTELERITFYGYLDARGTAATFYNTGLAAQRSINPGIQANTVNYNAAVGSNIGAGGAAPAVAGISSPQAFTPFTNGVLANTNWRTGRPLINGTGFSTKAVLGIKVKVSDDVDAGIELAAYSSQGNSVLDSYYGVNQPYLSNPWTGTTTVNGGGAGVNSSDHTPFTNMTLDHIWIVHNPSQTRLVLGAFNKTDFQSSIFSGLVNPNEFGPEYLDNYGFQLTGKISLDDHDDLKLRYELIGTQLPNGNPGGLGVAGAPGFGSSYWSHAEGGNIKLLFNDERGRVQFNFLHAADDASGGSAQTVGLLQIPNLTLNWVNPNGYYFNQLGGPNTNTAGIGSTSDKRPIPGVSAIGNDGSLATLVKNGLLPQGLPNVGGIGPQDETMYGANASYKFDNDYDPKIYGEYAHSIYKPQKNSGYSVSDDAFKAGVSAAFFDKQVELDAHYQHVGSRFDPFLIMIPEVGGITTPLWRTPDFNYYNNLYSLHDTVDMPQNREGIRVKGTWKFDPTGRVTVEYGRLTQVDTSLQDVRYSQGALGANTPNTPVLGYSPGFIEPVFTGFSPYTFTGAGGNGLAVPLENPRGLEENIYVSAGKKWLFDSENNNRGFTLSGGIKYVHFTRDSNMDQLLGGGFGIQAENQNLIDLAFKGWHVGVEYDLTDTFAVHGGYTQVNIFGHQDPLNLGGQYAESIGNGRFTDIDITQHIPDLGFDWKLTDDVTFGVNGRYYTFNDNLPTRAFVNPSIPALNINAGPNYTHPYAYQGLQIDAKFGVKF